MSAFGQLLDMNQDLHPKYVCLDSASDANAIYQYFRLNHAIPVIDHNKRKESKVKMNEDEEYINSDGIPICKKGDPIIYYGYGIQRNRKKSRCLWPWAGSRNALTSKSVPLLSIAESSMSMTPMRQNMADR